VTILGFDTATADAAVAVTRDGEVVHEERVEPGEGGSPRHSAALLPAIEAAAQRAGGWDAVDRIAVGIGPGSFTGLRIGIATARALGQGLGKPLVPVVTLEALGRAAAEHPGADAVPRLAALDARRGQLFAALYSPSVEELWPPFVAAPSQVGERIVSLSAPPLAVGDGALRFRRELEVAGAAVPEAADEVHRVAARHICRLAADREPVRPEAVEPIYLRAPDAKRWLERDR
jgi:tRNA threonylcarbamoyladenosine biosynthesis protein TsaB